MLRGLDPELTRDNLDAILAELERRRIPVLLAGMRAAPNLDPAYIASVRSDLSRARRAGIGAALYPFFLDGVAGQKGMVQARRMHPTFAGVKTDRDGDHAGGEAGARRSR